MSVNNGVISCPISILDLQKVLNTDESSLGALGKHQNINYKSEIKPRNSNYETTYGLYIPNFIGINSIKNKINNNFQVSGIEVRGEGPWKWVLPDKCQFSDFNGYRHNENRDYLSYDFEINGEPQELTNISIDKSDNLYFEVGNGSVSLLKANLHSLTDHYLSLLFIGENKYYIITASNPMYIGSSERAITTDLSILDSGEYKMFPCVSVQCHTNSVMIDITQDSNINNYQFKALPWSPITITLIGENVVNRRLELTYNGQDTSSNSSYIITNFTITNLGTQKDYFIIKDVSCTRGVKSDTISLPAWNMNDNDNLSTDIQPNQHIQFQGKSGNASGATVIRFNIYRRVFENNTYNYNYNTNQEGYTSEVKVCECNISINNNTGSNSIIINNLETPIDNSLYLDDLIICGDGILQESDFGNYTGGRLDLVVPQGNDISDIQINSGRNNIITIDDWAFAFRQLTDWTGGEGQNSSPFQIRLSSQKYNRTWSYRGDKIVEESGAPLLYGEFLRKLVRIPYSTQPFQFVDYVWLYPGTFSDSCLYEDSKGFDVWEYDYSTKTASRRSLNNNDIVQYTMEKISVLDYKYTFTVAPNNSNTYQYITLESNDDSRIGIDIVLEPQARNRIYYGGTSFGCIKALEDNTLYEFSVTNSKILTENSFIVNSGNKNYQPVVYYPSSDFDYTVSVTNSSGNVISYTQKTVMWGQQSYIRITANQVFNVIFNKK